MKLNIPLRRIKESQGMLESFRGRPDEVHPNSLEAIGALAICEEALREFRVMGVNRLQEMHEAVHPYKGYFDKNLLHYEINDYVMSSKVDLDDIKCGLRILGSYQTALCWNLVSEAEETQ